MALAILLIAGCGGLGAFVPGSLSAPWSAAVVAVMAVGVLCGIVLGVATWLRDVPVSDVPVSDVPVGHAPVADDKDPFRGDQKESAEKNEILKKLTRDSQKGSDENE